MKYAQIRKFDIANGPGIRSTIFVSGCSHACQGCFNQEYQDFDYGNDWTEQSTEEIISYLKDPNIKGLSLLGGEPMESAEDLVQIIRQIKDQVPKDIWIYSGYTFEQILEDPDKKALLKECQVLVDGLFIEDLKDLSLKFRGSSNQRIIDIEKSLKGSSPILYSL